MSLADYLVPRIKRHEEEIRRLHLRSDGPVEPERVEAHAVMLTESLRPEGTLRKLLVTAAENGKQLVQIYLPESIIDQGKKDLEMLPAAYLPFIEAVRNEELYIEADHDDFGGFVTLLVGVSDKKLGRGRSWGAPIEDEEAAS